MTRAYCKSAFWKERFIAGLPKLFAERVRNSINDEHSNLPYDDLTFGQIIGFINKEYLSLCNDLKLKAKLKTDKMEGRKELGSFCEQYGYERIVPTKYFEKTTGNLYGASGKSLNIQYKLTQAQVCNGDICFKCSFYLVKDLDQEVILGTPFLIQLYPITVTEKGLSSKYLNHDIFLEFTNPPSYRDVNLLKEHSISRIINNINFKKQHIKYLKDDIRFSRVLEQLESKHFKNRISEIDKAIRKEVCSTIPNAFWNRKKHIVTLPYIPDLNENKIPTKSRPIQMNKELLDTCTKEIQDLLEKGLIRPSKSPWSYAAFYVNNHGEIERGAPRLVINYKPLNHVLQWVRYPMPQKKDLLNRLLNAVIFSKFDLKSEFQKIMNDIFNPYKNFSIVYIDDVLIYSDSIEQHLKHLQIFLSVAKRNGLAVSEKKIVLCQTKIKFLGHEIFRGTITPIKRSLEFASKFPDQILDKTSLQRFLGCVNYISDFIPNIRQICEPLYQRLRKTPPAWSDKHTEAVKLVKQSVQTLPCLNIIDPKASLIVETDASDIVLGTLPSLSKTLATNYKNALKPDTVPGSGKLPEINNRKIHYVPKNTIIHVAEFEDEWAKYPSLEECLSRIFPPFLKDDDPFNFLDRKYQVLKEFYFIPQNLFQSRMWHGIMSYTSDLQVIPGSSCLIKIAQISFQNGFNLGGSILELLMRFFQAMFLKVLTSSKTKESISHTTKTSSSNILEPSKSHGFSVGILKSTQPPLIPFPSSVLSVDAKSNEIFAVLAQKAASMAKAESSRGSVPASEVGSDPDPNFEDDNEDDCLGVDVDFFEI
ncbi:Enzymatic polyprotein [Abeliophyllum distichum]|uniref:Enzymatic polyprotein n=1 Tax=Abeliophyllum distichum TaxID=126358 RepID=A0ABD1PRL1_9LAMI